jgi:hypothetical protein
MFYVQCSIIESAFSQAWWVTSEAGEGGRAGEEEKENLRRLKVREAGQGGSDSRRPLAAAFNPLMHQKLSLA